MTKNTEMFAGVRSSSLHDNNRSGDGNAPHQNSFVFWRDFWIMDEDGRHLFRHRRDLHFNASVLRGGFLRNLFVSRWRRRFLYAKRAGNCFERQSFVAAFFVHSLDEIQLFDDGDTIDRECLRARYQEQLFPSDPRESIYRSDVSRPQNSIKNRLILIKDAKVKDGASFRRRRPCWTGKK